jgi:hypothetical protein
MITMDIDIDISKLEITESGQIVKKKYENMDSTPKTSIFVGFYDDGPRFGYVNLDSPKNKDLQAAIDEVNEIAPYPNLTIQMML